MGKGLFDIISVDRLRRKAKNPGPESGTGLFAKMIIAALDASGREAAEAVFLEKMRDYFHNLAASSKRKYADALALGFCEHHDGFDELWEYLKTRGVTGQTYTKRTKT